MPQTVIATFYKFADLSDYRDLREPLRAFCREEGVRGSILLAAEGVNGTIAGPRQAVDNVLSYLRAHQKLAGMTHKESFADFVPFRRMKVRFKREIVNLGLPEINPNDQVGVYVDAAQWNDLIADPDVLLIDTRNDYEYTAGTFQGAINPHTRAFNQFPDFVAQNLDPQKHKKIAMFCTGGIRCEKATAYLLAQGFAEVYHLKDGILKYLETMPEEESCWEGECFVYDERVTVTHGVKPGQLVYCPTCQTILTEEDRKSPHYRAGICCPYCYEQLTPDRLARFEERQKQLALTQERSAQTQETAFENG